MSRAPPCYDDIGEDTPLLGKEYTPPVKQVLGLRRSSLLLGLYLLFYVVYLVTGGLVFAVLEGPYEAELRDDIAAFRNGFLARNPCVAGKIASDSCSIKFSILKMLSRCIGYTYLVLVSRVYIKNFTAFSS